MRFTIISLTILCLTGCPSLEHTRTLGDLQAEFGDVSRTQADCGKSGAVDEVCLSDFKAMHGMIEMQAVDTIGQLKNSVDTGDQQITVALYRLAALASLKADSGHAADYAEAGSTKCTALAGSAPARDCALLGVVGQYEVAEEYDKAVNCLKTQNCDSNPNPEKLASGFCSNYRRLQDKTNAAKNQPFLPDAVARYLDRQVAEFEKSMQSLSDHMIKGVSIADRPHDPCRCVKLAETDPAFDVECGKLPSANRMATFKATCIRRSLDETPSSCPSF